MSTTSALDRGSATEDLWQLKSAISGKLSCAVRSADLPAAYGVSQDSWSPNICCAAGMTHMQTPSTGNGARPQHSAMKTGKLVSAG